MSRVAGGEEREVETQSQNKAKVSATCLKRMSEREGGGIQFWPNRRTQRFDSKFLLGSHQPDRSQWQLEIVPMLLWRILQEG